MGSGPFSPARRAVRKTKKGRGPASFRPPVACRAEGDDPVRGATYDRAVWVTEISRLPTRKSQNNQYIVFRFNCRSSILTHPRRADVCIAVMGLASSSYIG